MAAPGILMRGLGYMRELRREGVPIHLGVVISAFDGVSGVEAVKFRDCGGREHKLTCDAVALGFGLKPETQLAELAGAAFAYDNTFRQWLPRADADGRCGGNVYVAGDGATVGGAEAAAITGQLAACAVLEDAGIQLRDIDRGRLRQRAARLRRFQRGISRAFAWPVKVIDSLDDSVMVCRCEGISTGELRSSIRTDFGPAEVNRLKAITRCGMGRCQGRFCGLAAAELTAQTLGIALEEVGRLRAQPPVKPIPLGTSLAENAPVAMPGGTSASA